ncbi:23S rRNA (uracil(1939)-C(5))-methyltransferase RlmD [Alteromonas sp. CYL-A6]|uniref:23S rRNA (uracil(1939)-C(5))-methyltransferase RlmD n=1 Tax=Alteromonas nitratireducens TaxID=3390813 RepID=UPI0034C4E39B
MVSFYKPTKRKAKNVVSGPVRQQVVIDDWDWQGQGVVRGKPVMFVEGALPGEHCEVDVTQAARQVAHGKLIRVDKQNSARRDAFCPVAAECGGCQLQHVDPDEALRLRQQAINHKLLSVLPQSELNWCTPLTGQTPAYRRKARLAVDARREGKVRVGFRAKRDNKVVNIEHCPVLETSLSALISPLKQVLNLHGGARHIGHISLMAGDNVSQITLKATRPLATALTHALAELAKDKGVNLLLENQNGDITPLHKVEAVTCRVTENRYLKPQPNDFIQVNAAVNRAMVEQALAWLAVKPGEKIADWFCGLGNFSLALADAGATVQAVEGVAAMVQQGQQNALEQGIDTIDWRHADLSNPQRLTDCLAFASDKVLLDPSREGAQAAAEALAQHKVDCIVYVSCNPGTFIRDAAILAGGGYRIEKIGLVEMFPYTQHLEVMALFTSDSLA